MLEAATWRNRFESDLISEAMEEPPRLFDFIFQVAAQLGKAEEQRGYGVQPGETTTRWIWQLTGSQQ